jgi:hypothetical protein
MAAWVTMDELINEMKLEQQSDPSEDDLARLQRDLDAAVEFVERIHAGRFNFSGAPSVLPLPGPSLKLGTLMMAIRLDTRRRSPDGSVYMGEQGAARVSREDPDISRLLRIGRHSIPRVG